MPDLSTNTHTNGEGLAAFLAAGIGALALGVIVILNEAGVVSVPAIYAPAGGVSGRTTAAVVIWLIAWVVLHRRWRGRDLDARRVHAWTIGLTVVAVALNFPPLWGLLHS